MCIIYKSKQISPCLKFYFYKFDNIFQFKFLCEGIPAVYLDPYNCTFAWQCCLHLKAAGFVVFPVLCALGSSFSRVGGLRPKGKGVRVSGWEQEADGWQIRSSTRTENDEWRIRRKRQGRGQWTGEREGCREEKDDNARIGEEEERRHPAEASCLKPAIITELSVQTTRTSTLSWLNFKT